MQDFVKLLAVTGPLIADRLTIYVRPSEVQLVHELPPEGQLGIVNSLIKIVGAPQPITVSGAADRVVAQLKGEGVQEAPFSVIA